MTLQGVARALRMREVLQLVESNVVIGYYLPSLPSVPAAVQSDAPQKRQTAGKMARLGCHSMP